MKSCIYCNSSDKLTESHIIPNALSNGTMKNYYVCPLHNNSFSNEFETRVINDLGIIANRLDIISSNGNDYPRYTVEYEWYGKIFVDKKHTSMNGWIDKILESTDKTLKIGPKNKVKTDKIIGINLGDENLKITYPINLEVFNSYEMKRLIAKIAYEWFCSFNQITSKPNIANDIRDYILGESVKEVVEFINDINIKNAFNQIGGDYSHKLISFINKNKKYCVIIAFWDIAYYAVEISDVESYLEGKEFYYREQFLDSSHLPYLKDTQREFEIEFESSLVELYNSDDIFQEVVISNSLKVTALNASEQLDKISLKINLMSLLGACNNYNYGQKDGFNGYYENLVQEVDGILHSSVVTPRKVKRIVNTIKFKDDQVDLSSLSIMQLPIIYFVYKLGKDFSDDQVINFKIAARNYIPTKINDLVIYEINKEIVSDSDWIVYLKRGIKKLECI